MKLTCAEAGKILAAEGDRIFSSCQMAKANGYPTGNPEEDLFFWVRFGDRGDGKTTADQKRFDF